MQINNAWFPFWMFQWIIFFCIDFRSISCLLLCVQGMIFQINVHFVSKKKSKNSQVRLSMNNPNSKSTPMMAGIQMRWQFKETVIQSQAWLKLHSMRNDPISTSYLIQNVIYEKKKKRKRHSEIWKDNTPHCKRAWESWKKKGWPRATAKKYPHTC